ncbi:MAG: dinitrogenase iron-molybdenum cofactor biosynthesis protein [Thermoprotei archaeon]|nr:MAG: dinitrogenase iron-molybdenum cofactor biosynthesis protein [Thermoprotei archaeon]
MPATGRLRVAVASQGQGGLDDVVSPVFGRCPTFTVVDVEGGEIKGVQVIPNQAMYAPHGAGIAAVQTLANLGVKIILAGRFGPWASQATMQFGIQTLTVPPGIKVRDAVYRYVLGR